MSEWISIRVYFEELFKRMSEHLETKILNLDIKTDLRFHETEKASCLSDQILEKRLEHMNEFRAQLKDQASTFLTRQEYDTKHGILLEKVRTLELAKAEITGKASQKSLNATQAISIVAVLIGIFNILLQFFK